MKIIVTLLLVSFISISNVIAAENFVEAQMVLKINDDGSKAYEFNFDAESETITVKMQTDWVNYNDKMHADGIDLNTGVLPYLVSPELPGRCKLREVSGQLSGKSDIDNNQIILTIKGPECYKFAEDFDYIWLKFSIYQVKTLKTGEQIESFHFWLFE